MMVDFISHRGKRILIPVVASLLLFGSVTAYAQDTSAADVLNRAYPLVTTHPSEAIPLFEQALRIDPNNVSAHRQLGYLYAGQQRNSKALDEFNASERLLPSDTVKLQIAYLLASMNKPDDAKQMFRVLQTSSDKVIAQRASEATATLSAQPDVPHTWTRIYADPYYDTRWNSNFIHADIQEGYFLNEAHSLSAYGIASLSTDTRSSSGAVPVIISDNSLLFGLGLQYKVFTGLTLNVQEGIVFNLIRTDNSDVKDDFRAVAVYGTGIYPVYTYHDDLRMTFSPLVDFYSSVGFYSRYHNGIGYAQLRVGARLLEVSRSTLDVYARGDLARDTREDFYNNIVEGGVGARLTPNVDWGLHLQVDYHRGLYWDVSDNARIERAALYDQYYSSTRIFLIFERTF